ncbi:MAG: SPFH/Band 7/PHB domain protein [Firmicutes bacterium]|nr:SPFH/Band 7/PHB domain protein [Bacillota bacterium]
MNVNNLLGISPGAIVGIVIGGILGLILFIIVIRGIRVVRQGTVVIVEKFGSYDKTLSPGLRYVTPILRRARHTISMKERVADFPPKPVITKDNVTMQIDTIVYWQVCDPKLFAYGAENPLLALENISASTLRNIIGEFELDETLTSRDYVNSKLQIIIDKATDAWGIKVTRVEIKNIILPRDIQDSMEKQMRAERGKREAILNAEGVRQSAILVAEGEKQAAVLRAEARKVALITEAEGQAEAIARIIAARPDPAYVTLQGFEALKVLANGQATKIVVPSNIADVAGLLTSLTEVVAPGTRTTGGAAVRK